MPDDYIGKGFLMPPTPKFFSFHSYYKTIQMPDQLETVVLLSGEIPMVFFNIHRYEKVYCLKNFTRLFTNQFSSALIIISSVLSACLPNRFMPLIVFMNVFIFL